jgi:spermine oxidase
LGVLKDRHQTLFTPQLPAKKVNAIKNIGFGTLGKVFLEFATPFWPTDPLVWVGYVFLWKDADKQSIASTDKAWLLDLVTFVRVDGFPNIIEALIAGERLKDFETHSDAKIIADCMWLLQKFLKKTLPAPTSMKRTKWITSRNFNGSYSFLSVAAEKNNVSPADLAQSILNINKKPILMFAGEATHAKYSSYAHGALSSGWKAANDLLLFLGL